MNSAGEPIEIKRPTEGQNHDGQVDNYSKAAGGKPCHVISMVACSWGKTVAFWAALGYELEFETDHPSGQLRHPSGGPFLFIAERPEGQELQLQPMVAVRDAATFSVPSSGSVVRALEAQHWNMLDLLLADPDGRHLSVQAPLPSEASKESDHG